MSILFINFCLADKNSRSQNEKWEQSSGIDNVLII